MRFFALLRVNLIQTLSHELSSLLSLLPTSPYLQTASPTFPPIPLLSLIPFQIYILAATIYSLQGNRERSIESLAYLIVGCKGMMRSAKLKEDSVGVEVWKARAEKVGLIMAEWLAELKVSYGLF